MFPQGMWCGPESQDAVRAQQYAYGCQNEMQQALSLAGSCKMMANAAPDEDKDVWAEAAATARELYKSLRGLVEKTLL